MDIQHYEMKSPYDYSPVHPYSSVDVIGNQEVVEGKTLLNSNRSLQALKHAISTLSYKTASFEDSNDLNVEDAICTALFSIFDEENQGFCNRGELTEMLTLSFNQCNVKPHGNDINKVVDCFFERLNMRSSRQQQIHSTSSFAEDIMQYTDFKHLYRQYTAIQTPLSGRLNKAFSHQWINTEKVECSFENGDAEAPVLSTWDAIKSIYTMNRTRIWWLTMYTIINLAFFIWQFYKFGNNKNAVALSGISVAWARGFAQVCLIQSTLLFVTVLHSLLQKFRQFNLLQYIIPFNDRILIHKICGYNMIISGLLHAIFQFYGYIAKTMHATPSIWYAGALAKTGQFSFPNPTVLNLLQTVPGWTGIILVTCSIIATPLTANFIRQKNYNLFWYSHYLFFPIFMIFFWFHGIESWLEFTQAWIWSTIPIVLYMVDRRHRIFKKEVAVLSAQISCKNTAEICFEKTEILKSYLPGMYVYINVPEISAAEWHPFTITTAPDDNYLSLHIRKSGDWTSSLVDLLEQAKADAMNQELDVIYPQVYIDGPVGSPAQEFLKYKTVLMVGAGIGVTPFVSILKDMLHQFNGTDSKGRPTKKVTQKIYFHWTTRDQESFRWFEKCMNDIAEKDIHQNIELHNYLSNILPTAESAPVKIAQMFSHAFTGEDFISGLKTKTRTHFGRPNWTNILSELHNLHEGETIGVLYCGNQTLEKQLHLLCNQFSRNKTKFKFHPEKF